VVIAGETRGPKSVTNDQIESVVRAAIKDIGYEQEGFHWNTCDIEILLHPQSADIAQGVDALQPGTNKEEGAGDQGIMFGYATNETADLMPAPIFYAHKILRLISEARHSGKETVLGPDSKSQVTVQYENGKPVGVREIVVSHQHLIEDMTSNQVRERVEPYVREALPKDWINGKTIWHVNPTGKFYIGGPDGDAGLTGRKIIVDTYGGAAPHGGGAFSGKDPTKVDRSAAYAARYLAKYISKNVGEQRVPGLQRPVLQGQQALPEELLPWVLRVPVPQRVQVPRARQRVPELLRVPDSFTVHRKLRKPLAKRVETLAEGGIEFGHAEALAFASLLVLRRRASRA